MTFLRHVGEALAESGEYVDDTLDHRHLGSLRVIGRRTGSPLDAPPETSDLRRAGMVDVDERALEIAAWVSSEPGPGATLRVARRPPGHDPLTRCGRRWNTPAWTRAPARPRPSRPRRTWSAAVRTSTAAEDALQEALVEALRVCPNTRRATRAPG